jgi:hopanoid C-3 methylase
MKEGTQMKILLVQPPWRYSNGSPYCSEPLSLEYIAAGVVKDHNVKIIDLRVKNNFQEEMEKFDPDIVGVSSYTSNINYSIKLCQEVKKINPTKVTVIGGQHINIAPQSVVDKKVDFMVAGEGVFPFQKLIEKLDRKSNDYSEVDGLIYQNQQGEFVINPPRPHPDLDDLPIPARHLTGTYYDLDQHGKGTSVEIGSIVVTKGCPYRCIFCTMWKGADGRYLMRDPQKVVEEFRQLPDRIFFADDESMINKKFIFSLCDEIEKAGIKKKIGMYGRCDTITKSPEMIKRLKEIGLDWAIIGLESYSEEGLGRINKGNKISDQQTAMEILRENGIRIHSTFMVEQAFEEKDFKNLEYYILQNGLENTCEISVLTPLPGTILFNQTKDQLITKNFDLFDLIHTVLPTKLPLKEFYELYGELWAKIWPANQVFPVRELLKRHYLDHEKDQKGVIFPTVIC